MENATRTSHDVQIMESTEETENDVRCTTGRQKIDSHDNDFCDVEKNNAEGRRPLLPSLTISKHRSVDMSRLATNRGRRNKLKMFGRCRMPHFTLLSHSEMKEEDWKTLTETNNDLGYDSLIYLPLRTNKEKEVMFNREENGYPMDYDNVSSLSCTIYASLHQGTWPYVNRDECIYKVVSVYALVDEQGQGWGMKLVRTNIVYTFAAGAFEDALSHSKSKKKTVHKRDYVSSKLVPGNFSDVVKDVIFESHRRHPGRQFERVYRAAGIALCSNGVVPWRAPAVSEKLLGVLENFHYAVLESLATRAYGELDKTGIGEMVPTSSKEFNLDICHNLPHSRTGTESLYISAYDNTVSIGGCCALPASYLGPMLDMLQEAIFYNFQGTEHGVCATLSAENFESSRILLPFNESFFAGKQAVDLKGFVRKCVQRRIDIRKNKLCSLSGIFAGLMDTS